MRILASIILLSLLGACAMQATKIDSGDVAVGDRLQFRVDGAWNHVTSPLLEPAQAWTMEGLPVDQLLIWSGVKDGEALHPVRSNGKSFNFRAGMQPDEIVALFEGTLTRDGSTFKLVKLEPSAFGGGKGLRFEYAMVRKIDNVPLQGVGFATVNGDELFAMLYNAPRLEFFARQSGRVEEIAKSAKVKAK